MSGRISREYIQRLLDHTDIVDVISARVDLKLSGRNFVACCPFHKEKTPSFSVSREKQFYHCFGCGVSGDAIGFLIAFEHIDFLSAVQDLSKLAGLTVPAQEMSAEDDQRFLYKKELLGLLVKASSIYSDNLRHSVNAKNYLQGRGISAVSIDNYQLGYALPAWTGLVDRFASQEGLAKKLIAVGLVIEKDTGRLMYDRFRDRIIFPIRDIKGNVVGFGGRALKDEKPKYLNSPESIVFSKGNEVFGLYEAIRSNRSPERMIVVEGYMDVISLSQHGFQNAVATLGTAINGSQIEKIFKFTNEIVFCFDGDAAGNNAAKKSVQIVLPLLSSSRVVKYLFLKDGNDPDSFIHKFGRDAFDAQLNAAVNCSDYIFSLAARGRPLDSPEARASFSEQSLTYIKQVPDGLYKQQLLSELASRAKLVNVPSGDVEVPQSVYSDIPEYGEPEVDANLPEKALDYLARLDAQAVAILIEYPSLFVEVVQQFTDWNKLLEQLPQLRLFQVGGMLKGYEGVSRAKVMGILAAAKEFTEQDRVWWDFVLSQCHGNRSQSIAKIDLFSLINRIYDYAQRELPLKELINLSARRGLTELEKQQLKDLVSKKREI